MWSECACLWVLELRRMIEWYEFGIFRVQCKHHKWTVNAMQTSFFVKLFGMKTTVEAETQKPTVSIYIRIVFFQPPRIFRMNNYLSSIAISANVFFCVCSLCRTKTQLISTSLRSFNLIILKWLIKNKFKSIFIKYFLLSCFITLHLQMELNFFFLFNIVINRFLYYFVIPFLFTE